MTELEKYKKALDFAVKFAYNIDCVCHLGCQSDECFTKTEEEKLSCLRDYFLRNAEVEE